MPWFFETARRRYRSKVQKHLDRLSHAGLVQTQTKGREKQYVFNPQSLQAASAWIETIGKQWDERLQPH
jgi:predicted transcriptional regulator